ncbi:hypothetical protein [Streptomyces avermitilis]|uniref:hypothetical protein n=1 Tax=Streptomyces avermitilis TaxID=33903 RepID=UPI00382799B1
MTDARENTIAAPAAMAPPRAAVVLAGSVSSHGARAPAIGLMPISLGTAGLGGRLAGGSATMHPAALPFSDAVYTIS